MYFCFARLPVRAQSLYTKSQSPPFCSPRYSMITPSPCGSPHNMSPGMSTFFYGRRCACACVRVHACVCVFVCMHV